jgi:hypothetical protein
VGASKQVIAAGVTDRRWGVVSRMTDISELQRDRIYLFIAPYVECPKCKRLMPLTYVVALNILFVFLAQSQNISPLPSDPGIQEIPAYMRADFETLAPRVYSTVEKMFGKGTLSAKPIYWILKASGPPRNRKPDDCITPPSSMIELSAKTKDQFAYQLAHELTHVVFSPCLTNGIIETICIASSYEVLERLASQWQEYSEFRLYEQLAETEYLTSMPIEVPYNMIGVLMDHDSDTLRRYLSHHRREIDDIDCSGNVGNVARAIQSIAAIVLRYEPITWSEFVKLRECLPSAENHSCLLAPFVSSCLGHSSQPFCRFWACPWH